MFLNKLESGLMEFLIFDFEGHSIIDNIFFLLDLVNNASGDAADQSHTRNSSTTSQASVGYSSQNSQPGEPGHSRQSSSGGESSHGR